jgi:hypothetical protein
MLCGLGRFEALVRREDILDAITSSSTRSASPPQLLNISLELIV